VDAIKLLLAFSPWIAFWIISSGHSMLSLQIGICVASLLVVVMGLTKLHRGAILWAGVIFFAFALVSVAWLKEKWVIQHLGVLASGTLFAATLVSILLGHPFTEDYAREHVPQELWDSPVFIRSCYTVTSAWGVIFLANTLVNFAKLYWPKAGEWLYQGLEFFLIISGVAFTTIYARHAKKKRLTLSEKTVDSSSQ
jgi:hypothetical protein